MYGVVNRALEEHIVAKYGMCKWRDVSRKADVDVDVFVSNEGYPDDITYKLVGAASETLGVDVPEILKAFGEHWVLETGVVNYGALLRSGGSTLKEFLVNLPHFHARVRLLYPNLQPPEFACSDVTDESLRMHYMTKRPGLTDFVVGLLHGVGKLYDTDVAVSVVESKDAGADHDVFEVRWRADAGTK